MKILIALICAASLAPAQDASLTRLEREVARLAISGGGVVGAAATHLQSGRRISLRGAERFPMASSYKVPIAVQLLHRVDQGQLRMDQMVELKQGDIHPGSGTLSDLFNKPGVDLSVHNLLELMLLISDNSATDVVLRLAGGPQAVTARMRELEIEGVRVDRPTVRLIADWMGAALPPESEWFPALYGKLFRSVPEIDHRAAARKFDDDPRDTSTPEAMVALLEKIYRRQALAPETSELLLDTMRRCRTGEARLKGLLPAGTEVRHKTGTIGGTTNDVGIITLPDDAGHVALAVFVKSSERDIPARERAIAEIARAIHDFFVFERP